MVHFVPLRLCSKKEFEKNFKPRLENALSAGYDEFFTGMYRGSEGEEEKKKSINFVVDQVFKYIIQKRHFLKAYEVIEDLATKGYIKMMALMA